jgi:hypothetical protein
MPNSKIKYFTHSWNEHKPFFSLSGLFLLLFYTYFLPVDEAYGRGHDFLQSIFSLYFTRAEVGNFFFDFDLTIPQLINGLPFNALAIGDFSIGPNLYLLLPPFEAYVANEFIRRFLALTGMYLLIKDYILPPTRYGHFVAALVAFSFAVLPDQPNRFGTITMQPMLYWAFLNIWFEDNRARNYLVIFMYPLYSSLVLGGFVMCGYFLAATVLAYITKRPNRRIIFYLFLFITVFYVFMEIRMFYLWFVADYTSMRLSSGIRAPSFERFISTFVSEFFRANHANHITEHSPAILVVTFVTLITIAASKVKWPIRLLTLRVDDGAKHTHILFLFLFALVLVNTTINSLDTAGFMAFKHAIGFPFSFHRMDVSSPVIWRLLLALSIYILATQAGVRWRWISSMIAVLVAMHTLLQFPGVKGDLKIRLGIPENVGLRAFITGREVPPEHRYHPGQTPLKVYYQTSTFPQIEGIIKSKTGLEKSEYRTVSIDLVPALARYHGYYTLDAWLWDGPASYVDEFSRISGPEYAKDKYVPINKGVIQHQIYVSEESRKPGGLEIDLDTCAFSKMGGKVVFSGNMIIAPSRIGFGFLGQFGSVYVYLLNENWPCD